MNKLEKALKQWVSLGFIDQKQANQIHQYESTQKDSSWVLFGLLVLGAIIIGIGIISVIAANWQQIPDFVKLTVDFALLIALSVLIVRAWSLAKEVQFEILLLSFMIFCLASIGLISQVYNTGGELYQALMLWSVITFPAAIAARSLVIPFIWIGGFLTSLMFTVFNSPLLYPIFNSNFQAIFMAIPLLCACLIMFSERWGLESATRRALQAWFFISGLIAIVVAEIGINFNLTERYLLTPYFPGFVLAVLAIIGILKQAEYNNTQKLLLLLTLGVFLILFFLPLMMITSSVIYAVFTILILMFIAVFLASLKQRQFFQWILFFIGIRFLILYFDALGGLALTGLGLIISGIVIITLAVLWSKYKSTIAVWVERWIQ